LVPSFAVPPATTGHNNIYDPSTDTWANNVSDCPEAGRSFYDAAAAVMTNGKALLQTENAAGTALVFYEYDPAANTFTQAPSLPAGSTIAGLGDLLQLPNGQLLYFSMPNLSLYTPAGPQETYGGPSILTIFYDYQSRSYIVNGTTLNGLTTGAAEDHRLLLARDHAAPATMGPGKVSSKCPFPLRSGGLVRFLRAAWLEGRGEALSRGRECSFGTTDPLAALLLAWMKIRRRFLSPERRDTMRKFAGYVVLEPI
jgi:hypothetical protein